MRLSEKLAHLRQVEGMHRGLDRSMSKAEVVRAMERELGEAISHAYLCQLEGGTRLHMTGRTRELLARFFKVLPGYLVDDPEGFETSLRTEMPSGLDGLSTRLAAQAEELRRGEPALAHVLFKLSRTEDPMRFVTFLDRLLELPHLALGRVAEAIDREEGGDNQ
jgi:hypothetical protein